MSLITLSGHAAVGAIDQGPRRHAPDAAVAHRSGRRRAEVQERHVAVPGSDRHHRRVGRWRRAAGRPGGHAAAQAAATPTNEWRATKDGYGPPDLVITSHRLHDAGAAPGCLVPARERHPDHRAALGEDGRDAADHAAGPQDHAPRDRLSGAEQRSRCREHRYRDRRGTSDRRRRSGQSPSAADGMGDRQELRHLSAPTPASCCCRARRSPGTSTSTPPAKRSRPACSSACGSIRKARSRPSAAI